MIREVAAVYDVQPRFVVAIIGLESDYGTYPINEPLFDVVATLAYDARRSVQFRRELLGSRRPLTLEATLNKTAPYPIGTRAEVMGVSLRGTLERSEFGMTYGVADGLVGDAVEILIELEAWRVSAPQ